MGLLYIANKFTKNSNSIAQKLRNSVQLFYKMSEQEHLAGRWSSGNKEQPLI